MPLRDPVPLDRTFAFLEETEDSGNESDVDRSLREEYTPTATWSSLLRHPLVVILGERGLGKTTELKAQAVALEKSGKSAFFMPLYRLTDREQSRLVFASLGLDYERWRASTGDAFFFIDSIDETRLLGPAAFEGALALFAAEIGAAFDRTSIFISSRSADWSLARVRDAVETHLVRPMRGLQSDSFTPLVVRLQRLSATDARRLAAAHRVKNADDFWQAITSGGYEFLATRPLDLEWLTTLWNSAGRFGSYTELLEASIESRLTETNEVHVHAGAEVSPRDLREMAEQLAAVCSYSSRPFIQLSGPAGAGNALSVSEALPERSPTDWNRLLHSALFHESSFGQLQFSHRVLREYLAACWMRRRLDAGLPPAQGMRLFVDRPFEATVLLPSRRAELSWLASMSPPVCERVARSFPELLSYEGDPARWSVSVLLEALDAYLLKVKAGYRPDWRSDTSDLSRLARALPAGALTQRVWEYREHKDVLIELLALVRHGEVHGAASVAMQLYTQSEPQMDEAVRYLALLALGRIATHQMRAAVAHDLVSGEIKVSRQIGAALEVTGVTLLTAQELADLFLRAGGGHREGTRIPATLVGTLLPTTSLDDALKLLQALLAALPSSDVDALRVGDVAAVNGSWILGVLPECLLRVVQLTSREAQSVPDALIDAGLLVQGLRNGGSEEDAIHELRLRVAKIPELHKRLTLAIAMDDRNSLWNHLLDPRSLITFGPEVLGWLTDCANQKSAAPEERHRWYEIARTVAIYVARGSPRRIALAALIDSPDRTVREPELLAVRASRARAICQFRQNQQRLRASQKARERKNVEIRTRLQQRLRGHSANHCDSINAILEALAAQGVQVSVSRLDVEAVTRSFGAEVAALFDHCLREAWKTIRIADPRSCDDTARWEGVLGAASLNHAFRCGLSVQAVSEEEATRAVQLSVWSDDKPVAWMAELAALRPDVVREALLHWFDAEVTTSSDDIPRIGQTIRKILQAEDSVRRDFLLHAATLMRSGQVASAKLRRRFADAMLDLVDPPLEEVAGLAVKELNKEADTALCGDNAWQQVAHDLDQAGHFEDYQQILLGLARTSFDGGWFSVLVRASFVSAMDWVKDRLDARGEELLVETAASMARVIWASGLLGTSEEVDRAVWLFRQLSPLLPRRPDPVNESAGMLDPVRKVVSDIPTVLAQLPGSPAHQALSELGKHSKLMDHSVAEAERRKIVATEQLLHFGELHTRDARSEGELFEQVLARLEDIREDVENGPFSERGLFTPGTPEKKLQIWLASRFSATPQRRFAVPFRAHREPQVDLDNRPDIEISSGVGKVCIEIKPLDRGSAGYTANQLADALENQLVRKYLHGNNCRHGILVVLRLEERRWRIPGGQREGSFEQLVSWLRARAELLKGNMPGVEGLRIVGIDLVVPA